MRTRMSTEAQSTAHRLLHNLNDDEADRQKHNVFRLAKEFEQAHGRPPELSELHYEFEKRLNPDGKISFFFNQISAYEKKYPEVYYRLMESRQVLDSETFADMETQHDIISGNLNSLEAWINEKENSPFEKLKSKLCTYLEFFYLDAAERLLDHARNALNPKNYQDLIAAAKEHLSSRDMVIPLLRADSWELADDEAAQLASHQNLSDALSKPLKYTYGLEAYINDEEQINKFPFALYTRIREFLSYEIPSIDDLNQSAYIPALMFRNYQQFIQYCEKWPHFFMGQLSLKNSLYCPDFKYDPDENYLKWGEAALQYGPQIFHYLQFDYLLDETPLDRRGQIDLKRLKNEIYDLLHPQQDDELNSLRRFCFDHQLSEQEFQSASYFIKKYKKENYYDGIPDIRIDGENFGLQGYTFRKLDYDDPRFFFPGRFTGCCERLMDFCENTIVHGYKTRESSFYVLTDPKDRIIAHSWVWISNENYFVFDGFEARQNDKRVTDNTLRNILKHFSRELQSAEYSLFDISGIALGGSGKSLKPELGCPDFTVENLDQMTRRFISDEDVKHLYSEHEHVGFSSKFYLFDEFPVIGPVIVPSVK